MDAAPAPFKFRVNARALSSSESMVPLKVMLLSVVVSVTVAALKVTAPVYVCVPEVVTLAPRLEVPETSIEAAPVIAASKSSAPLMSMTPIPCSPPMTALNSVSEAVTVRLCSLPSELIVADAPKVTFALEVAKVVLPVKVTAPL